MTIEARVHDIVRELFNEEGLSLSDDSRIADIPGADSLAQVNLMFALEEEFGVVFPDDGFAGFTDIGDLKRELERLGAR